MDIKEEAINDIENFINSLDEKRANILSYWIKDYVRYLKKLSRIGRSIKSVQDPQNED